MNILSIDVGGTHVKALASGQSDVCKADSQKAMPLKAVRDGPYEPDQLPAQLIKPTVGRLIWLIDRAAAARLGNANGRAHNATAILSEAA
jgi:hypothetical protein